MKDFDSLFSLATAGVDVRAEIKSTPETNSLLKLGESPAGVEAAIEWFKQKILLGEQVFLFLVGGPGGGKSHAAATIGRELRETQSLHPGLAHRKHVFEHPKTLGKVAIINDATMRGEDGEIYPLLKDIESALESQTSLVCCVNRGIIVEEEACSDPNFADALSIMRSTSGRKSPSEDVKVVTQQLVNLGSKSFEVVTVNFDYCSLFEELPKVSYDSQNGLAVEKYRIANFKDRYSQGVSSPASRLITAVIQELKESTQSLGRFNPIAANLQSLQNGLVVQAISNLCRAAELQSGRRFTYRELWGLVARIAVGTLPNEIRAEAFRGWCHNVESEVGSNKLDFEEFVHLARFRTHQALFGVREEFGQEKRPRDESDPVLMVTFPADPVTDMRPGYFTGLPEQGWASVLHDAFAGALHSSSPLQALSTALAADDRFIASVTDFEWAMDEAFVRAMEDEKIKDHKRHRYVQIYAGYLSRLYAVSQGISAFLDVIAVWSKLWTLAPNVPQEHALQILTLVRPKRGQSDGSHGTSIAASSSLIPLFDSRTNPIVGDLSEPLLALQVSDLSIATSKDGDALFLELAEGSTSTARVLLDFPLLRESLACIPDGVGVTEKTSLTAPRLERLRSANLVLENQVRSDKYRIAFGGSESPITVSDLGG